MTQSSFPFDSQTSTESDWSHLLRYISAQPGGGLVGVPGDTTAKVTADSSGMNVKVAAGTAMVRGHLWISDATVTLTIGGSNATLNRIDSIVLTLDPTANSIVLAVVPGTAAASPVAPTLTQTDTAVYQLLLANVLVPAAAATIAAGNVTDLRTYMGANVGVWTTATRPTGATGLVGYNTTAGYLEQYNGTAWGPVTPTTFDASVIASGTLGVTRGGTGQAAFSSGFIKSDGTTLTGGNTVAATDIPAAQQAAITAGKLYSGATTSGTAFKVFVQSGTPTGASTGDLWFW